MGIVQRLQLRKELLANQWLPLPELQAIQFSKLKQLLSHAYKNVPFHRNRFKESGVDLDSVNNISDLKRIPITTKDNLRTTPLENLIAQGVNPASLKKVNTSGTTGAPAFVYYDKVAAGWTNACGERVFDSIGLDPWEREAILCFSGSQNSIQNTLGLRLKSWAVRRRYRYGRQFPFTYKCDEILEDVLKFRPVAVEGQPAYLRELVNALRASGKSLELRLLLSHGDILDPATRNEVESFFHCPVYDTYGARDVGSLAWQCKERKGYHMNIDVLLFEFVDDAGEDCSPGEPGNIVITNLTNYSFPIIRYKLGDVASMEGALCSCGRGLPLIRSIEGRSSDSVVLPKSNRKVSPRTVVSELRQIPDLPRFQLEGTAPDAISLRFFSESLPNETVQSALAHCRNLFSDEISVKPELVKGEPRAKIRAVLPYQQKASVTVARGLPAIQSQID